MVFSSPRYYCFAERLFLPYQPGPGTLPVCLAFLFGLVARPWLTCELAFDRTIEEKFHPHCTLHFLLRTGSDQTDGRFV